MDELIEKHENNVEPKELYLNLALVIAGLGIVLFLVQTIMGGGMFMNLVLGLLNLLVFIITPIIFVRRDRAQLGNVISFGRIFRLVFLGLALGGIVSSGFTYVYVHYINPEYVGEMVYKTLESTKSVMEGSVPESQMNEILRKTEEGILTGFSPAGLLRSFGIALALYAVYALILGFAMKKDPPYKDPPYIEENPLQSTSSH